MSVNNRVTQSNLRMPPSTSRKRPPKNKEERLVILKNKKSDHRFINFSPMGAYNRSSFTEKVDKNSQNLKKNSLYSQRKQSLISQECQEKTPIKAKPFKKKVGFFVKKSGKKLTVPMAPKLGRQNRMNLLYNHKGPVIPPK